MKYNDENDNNKTDDGNDDDKTDLDDDQNKTDHVNENIMMMMIRIKWIISMRIKYDNHHDHHQNS